MTHMDLDVRFPMSKPAVVCRYCGWHDRLTLVDGQFECKRVSDCSARSRS